MSDSGRTIGERAEKEQWPYTCRKCGGANASLNTQFCEKCSAPETPTPLPEQVNHPAHYGGEKNVYEVIKVLEAWLTPEEFRGFLKGNVLKYLARARLKGSESQDYKKAGWYQDALEAFDKKEQGR